MTAATILLVEDDQSLLDGMSDLLEVVDLGYDLSVLTAANGRQGLAIMRETVPDLVISDIMMPTMGGFEFLEHIRGNSAWVHIPVIFLSARGTKEDIRAGRKSSAEMYITKPFNNNELLELVKSQLDRTFQLQSDRARRLEDLQHNIIQLLNHEFRTPLTYLTAYYEMLADGLPNQSMEFVQEYLRGIQVGAVRMTRLIDNFVRVIELRTGESREEFLQQAAAINNLSEIILALCQEWQGASDNPVKISYSVPDKLPPIWGVPAFIREILDRLLDNAVKFTVSKRHPDGEVVITAEKRFSNGSAENEDVICISIQDNGIGFPQQVRNQIFDLFFQYNREHMEQQGSGSGLTIAKGLVEIHNGRIEVQSQVGSGSTFSVVFPVFKGSNSGNNFSIAPQILNPNRSATILLVEDEWYLLDGLRELLEIFECEYNLRVLTAKNGVEALEVLENNQPDLIITDIMMPRMGGYEFLEKVRENPALLQIPVILLTARGERQDILKGKMRGAEEYIVKPYESDELLELVVKQLNRHFQIQGAMRQDFDELKRGILDLLQPDFRNPLNLVYDYSQKLETSIVDVQTDEEMRDSLKGIQSASRRIAKMVEDFIFLAEIRTGEAVGSFNLQSRPTNASIILMEACDYVRADLKESKIRMRQKIEPVLPPAMIDNERLKSGVQRLIYKMLDYCAELNGDSILVGSVVKDDFVHLVLGVDGVNFDSKEIKEINQLFYRDGLEDFELSDYDPDLLIAKGIVGLHNGRLRLDDKPGVGTRFVISLPVYEPTIELEHV